MKTIYSIAFGIILCFLVSSLFAGNKGITADKESKVKQWLQNQPLAFIENKGQFTTTDGKPADNVLFKASYGNCDIYITTEGLSYVFVKTEEKRKVESEKWKVKSDKWQVASGPGKEQEENKIVSYYRLDMNLVGANIDKASILKEQLGKQGHYNYFYANCPEGIYDVQEYGKITIKNIYKGIDWVIYTNPNAKDQPLKYDFVVHPGADYKDIQIKFLNAQSTTLTDNNTKLKIETIAGTIEEGNLYSYLLGDMREVASDKRNAKSEKSEVKSKYNLSNDSIISFEIAGYDTSKTLVIDPLVWATYYGGTGHDSFTSICVDSQDNIYITGCTTSTNFPSQQLIAAYWQPGNAGTIDAFILKFNSQGQRLWATYYGGSHDDLSYSICVDSQDNIFITGFSYSTNFPTQQLISSYYQSSNAGEYDVFIIKFDYLGQRQWATYYGGNVYDNAYSICVDSQDNIYITGMTDSYIFPTQQLSGAYNQLTHISITDVFILKFNNQGVRLWATFYGGMYNDAGNSICIDSQDNIYISGWTFSPDFPTQQLTTAYYQSLFSGLKDTFILKFNNQGQRLWATFYGGNGNENSRSSIIADNLDNIYITGTTNSTNFPVQQLTGAYWQATNIGGYDAYILKFNSQGVRLWATYYGGNGEENYNSFITADNLDNIYISGSTTSLNFPCQPLTGEYYQANINGIQDAFILKFNNQGARQWATYYGSSNNGSHEFGSGIAYDSQNNIYFIGESDSIGAYIINPGNGAYFDNSYNGNADSYILKIGICNYQMPTSIHTNRNNICSNDSGNITFTAIGGVGDTLKWYSGSCGLNYIGMNSPFTIPSPTLTTTYFARWEKNCGFSECDSIRINIYPVLLTILNPVICQGKIFSVGMHTYTATGTYNDTLTTYLGCDSIVTTNLMVAPVKQTVQNPVICQNEIFLVGNHVYSLAGIYKDTLTTYLGCDSIVITNLTVNPVKHININPVICDGEGFTVGSNQYIYTGIYTDILFTTSGCDSIVTTNLTVKPLPVFYFGKDSIICEGDNIELNVNAGYTSYSWQDGSTNNSFMVLQPGVYWVTVNYNNCIKSDTISYKLCEPPLNLWIPNAFTPNGDGLNDIFKIESINTIKNFHLYIYNRWGQLFFETSDIKRGWDGSYKEKDAPRGVYIWKLTYHWIGNFKEYSDGEMNGTVTLVR